MNSGRIDLQSIRGTTNDGGRCQRPTDIGVQCPHCGEGVHLNLRGWELNSQTGVGSAKSICPLCKKAVVFSAAFVLDANNRPAGTVIELRIFPAHSATFALPDFPEDVPISLRKSLQDTIKAYNAGIYGLTTTAGRRTLEGILKFLVSEDKRKLTLFELAREVESSVELKAPLINLTTAIRKGGNLGAHFDPDNEPDREMAKSLVELLIYLIDFLYILPSKIQGLERRIDGSDFAASGNADKES